MTKWDSSQGCKDGNCKSINITPHKQQQRQKSHDHTIDAEKAFDKVQHAL